MKISTLSALLSMTTSSFFSVMVDAEVDLTSRGVENLGLSDKFMIDYSDCMYNLTITFKHDANLPIPSGPADCNPAAEGGPAIAPDGLPYVAARDHYKLMDETIRMNTPFDHYGIDFQPCGHPALGVFTSPHYDVHIYLMEVALRELMTCDLVPGAPVCNPEPGAQSTDAGKAFFFADGMIPGDAVGHKIDNAAAVPYMGIHSLAAEWFSVEAATAANLTVPFLEPVFVTGGYNNSFVFWEPMIPLTFMTGDEDNFYEEDLSYVGDDSPYLPDYYSVAYTASTGETTITLKGGMAMECTVTQSPTFPTSSAGSSSTALAVAAALLVFAFL